MYAQRSCAVVPAGSWVSFRVCLALYFRRSAMFWAATIRTESLPIRVLHCVWNWLVIWLVVYVILAFCHMPTRDHLMSSMVLYSSNVVRISSLLVPSGISLMIMVWSSWLSCACGLMMVVGMLSKL